MTGPLLADPAVTLVAADVDRYEAQAWYCEGFLEEVTSWGTPEELQVLLAAVKGRRRFQGFGKSYGQRKTDDGEHLLAGESKQLSTGSESPSPKKVYKASGGAAKGGSKAVICDVCGGRMRFLGIASTPEDAEEWLRGPPAGAKRRG
jgi:hypothetical protein